MSNPARNATTWFVADGYDPKNKGLNGRRVAGESYLRGFLQHADVDVLRAVVGGVGAKKDFEAFVEPWRNGRPVETYFTYQSGATDPIGTLYYPPRCPLSKPGVATIWANPPLASVGLPIPQRPRP